MLSLSKAETGFKANPGQHGRQFFHLSIVEESRFINNPSYERTTQMKSVPGLGRKPHGNGIDGWVGIGKGMIGESK